MKKGHRLRAGDLIGMIAPASPCSETDVFKAKKQVESLGFQVKLGASCFNTYGGYLAGTPESRAIDVNSMFTDPQVDAVICLRGGYGSSQLLKLLDYQSISKNPKLLIGYSDITALHIAVLQYAGLATLHGPMGASELFSMDPLTRNCLTHVLTSGEPLGKIQNPEKEEIHCLVNGRTEGKIVGGNLSVISSLMGTPYEIDVKGKILLLEDVDEEPYRIDRMFTQLALAGKFEEAVGIVLGTWTNCESKKYPDGFSVPDLFKNIIAPYNKPTIWNLQSGHGDYNIALPLGVDAVLDAEKGMLDIKENVTED